ncbi:MAG: dolichyl-phosphate beta-D-mannosyltransferase [Candidatus Marinimicrobia bacterium]|nr:dolichyl-phosphate beta-D-mannosyltransferase [Candidatus Neomarinimicrobiota bacterium]
MSKDLVIIPTYNESDNIKQIIDLISKLDIALDILVVDDNSPDGTAEIVNNIIKNNLNIYLLNQDKKAGLGTAYKAGFKWAIEKEYDRVIQIDADLSHNPNSIPDLLEECSDFDVVIGSRYINGINVVNWPMSRLLLSYFANKYVRFFTRMPVNDATSGFKCIKTKVINDINMDNVLSQGYSFQIEMTFLAWMKNYRIKEVPIIFCDRTIGKSKMSKAIVREAIFMVPKLALKRIFKT